MNTNLLTVYEFTNAVSSIGERVQNIESYNSATMLMVCFSCGVLLVLIITNRIKV